MCFFAMSFFLHPIIAPWRYLDNQRPGEWWEPSKIDHKPSWTTVEQLRSHYLTWKLIFLAWCNKVQYLVQYPYCTKVQNRFCTMTENDL